MLRSIPRATGCSSLALLRSSSSSNTATTTTTTTGGVLCTRPTKRTASVSAHAISNPTLAGIEKRWEGMPPQEQADLWMALRDRMKVDWHQMTMQEKKAAYWIAFGPHGPRALPPPGEGKKIFAYTMIGVGVSFVLFYLIHSQARPAPGTMTKEYQEMTNEYLKSQNTEAITGVSSENYKGKGMVQSGPKRDAH